jgi:hypothetical protein
MEVNLSRAEASYGEHHHNRAKPSDNRGQHCGLKTAATAS